MWLMPDNGRPRMNGKVVFQQRIISREDESVDSVQGSLTDRERLEAVGPVRRLLQ